MVNLSWEKLLRTSTVVLAVISILALGPRLRAQCDPNNSCSCQNWCTQIVEEQFQCRDGNWCTFHVCIGGLHPSIGANSTCVYCCNGSNTELDWYATGSCLIGSPVVEKRSADVTGRQLFFLRG